MPISGKHRRDHFRTRYNRGGMHGAYLLAADGVAVSLVTTFYTYLQLAPNKIAVLRFEARARRFRIRLRSTRLLLLVRCTGCELGSCNFCLAKKLIL